mgnify:CR=1 FL=1
MLCANCNKHKGTETWVGSGGIMDWVHGNYSMWCRCCILKAQLKHAKERAKEILKLENKLKYIKCT